VSHSDVGDGLKGTKVHSGPPIDDDSATKINDNPVFRIVGGNLLLQDNSPCIYRGTGTVDPADSESVDEDADLSEKTPDIELQDRVLRIVDMGYDEARGRCLADRADFDGEINVSDLLALLAQWGGIGLCDIADGGSPPFVVNVSDLLALLAAWGTCAAPGGEVPDAVEECMQMYSSPADQAACITRLCESGQIPASQCPD
jgi:hypothetical protein